MAHVKSWKVLRKSCRAALIAAPSLFSLPCTEREIYTAPLDLEFPVLSFFFLFLFYFTPRVFYFSEDLCLCTLKSLFPVLSHGKKTEKKSEGGGVHFGEADKDRRKVGKSVFFPHEIQWDFISDFYHPNNLKSGDGSGGDIMINPVHLNWKFKTLRGKLGSCFSGGKVMKQFCSAVRVCYFFLQRGNDRVNAAKTATFWSWSSSHWCHWCHFFTEPIMSSFSNEVNPNLVGCRLHIVWEIKAHFDCVKLVYCYYTVWPSYLCRVIRAAWLSSLHFHPMCTVWISEKIHVFPLPCLLPSLSL